MTRRLLLLLAPLPLAGALIAQPPPQGIYTARTPIGLGTGDASCPALTADELYIVFASRRSGGAGNYDLWESTRTAVGAPWSPPTNTNLALLNTGDDEYEPHISFDGRELYFVRATATPPSSIIMVSLRTPTGTWGAPSPLPAPVNSSGVPVDDPHMTADGLTLYFAATSTSGQDIYTVTRSSTMTQAWAGLKAFTVANGSSDDRSPAPDGDGGVVFFASNRAGTFDFYMTWRDSMGVYLPPVLVTDLNTPRDDRNGQIGRSSGQFYVSEFSTTGVGGMAELCPVPIPPSILGQAAAISGDSVGMQAPFIVKTYHYNVSIGAGIVSARFWNWLKPRPPTTGGGLLLSFFPPLSPPPQLRIPGFTSSLNLHLGPPPPVGLSYPIPASGPVPTPLPIPNDPMLIGQSVWFQFALFDVAAGSGALSHLMHFRFVP